MSVQLYLGDCLEVMRTLDENSIDTCITDPPYELGFMGKKWDSSGIAFQPETWQAVYRVLKPGALLLAFGGTRTYHRMVCAIEDAGFEIRDMVEWVYGSGFPKSYDIGKGIDKQAGAEREVVGDNPNHRPNSPKDNAKGDYNPNSEGNKYLTAPSTPEAQLWDGWGTALKPAHEPIVVAMKPVDGNFVNNALTWGVAGLWIDGGRVEVPPNDKGGFRTGDYTFKCEPTSYKMRENGDHYRKDQHPQGRFPANVIHDGSDEVTGLFPQTKSGSINGTYNNTIMAQSNGDRNGKPIHLEFNGDSGSAARFFMSCKQDDLCELCFTPKHSIMSGIDNSEVIRCRNISANNVEKNLTTTQAVSENIAQLSVPDWLIEKAVHFAKSVGNLCDSCAMSIVREVAEIKTWDSKRVASQVIQDFIGNSNECILIQNLAHYAGLMESIDTTPTTTSLSKLFGCASRVITNYIQETEKTAPKRFLYTAKASRSERNAGLEGINGHPTVKPLALMRYLVRLTKTPTGGVVLDPFMGSGTTGCACALEGRDFIGIEREADYLEIAEKRIKEAQAQPKLELV